MKRITSLFLITLIFFSCDQEEQPTRTDENLVQNLSSGVWEMGFLLVDKTDQSADFQGVGFVFLSNGQVEALRGTQLLAQGTWSTGSESGRIQFQLSFPSNTVFEKLSTNWYQASIRQNIILFRKDQPGSEDYFTLVKR